MLVIRPTAALAKRMKIKLLPTTQNSSTLLGDWFACDLVMNSQQYILCVSEHGRLPLLLKAAPYKTFSDRLALALPDLLQGIGIPEDKIQLEVSQMNQVILAKTNNRSILGSINEFRYQLDAFNQVDRLDTNLLRISLDLAETISLVLPNYTPKDTVFKLFG